VARRVAPPTDQRELVEQTSLDGVEVLRSLGIDEARVWLETRFREDATRWCGPEGKRDPERVAKRYGGRPLPVTLRDRVVPNVYVPRIMLRGARSSINVPFYTALVGSEKREKHRTRLRLALDGVTTRSRSGVTAHGPEGKAPRGEGKSARSNSLKFASKEEFRRLITRPLGDVPFAAVMMDGTELGGRTVLLAVGYAEDGKKVPLGVAEAQSENPVLVERFLKRLVKRGADLSNVLWVLDGGQSLRDGIHKVYGENAQIQNCIEHVARTVESKTQKLAFHGVNKLLGKALKVESRQKALTRAATLSKQLLDVGYPDAAALVRERVKEVNDLRRKTRGRDRTRIDALVEDTTQAVAGMIPRNAWVGINASLHAAWKDKDPNRALSRLRKEAEELREAGWSPAGDSVERWIEEQVTVTRLGVTDDDLHASLRTNNAIENLNRQLRSFTRRHHTRWRPGAMRQRWVAAKVLDVEERFKLIERPERLRQLSLNVLKARHPNVQLGVEVRGEVLDISGIAVEPELRGQGKAAAALHDLLAWANGRGLAVGVTPVAQESGMDVRRLTHWFGSYGFVANGDPRVLADQTMVREPGPSVERARAAELAATPTTETAIEAVPMQADFAGNDPLDQYRSRLGEVLGGQVGSWAIEAGATIAAERDDKLTDRLERMETALKGKPRLRDRIHDWHTIHGEAAATLVALERTRAERATVASDQGAPATRLDRYRDLLGGATAEQVEARAAELAGVFRDRDERGLLAAERKAGDPFGALEEQAKGWMADSGKLAAEWVAVRRELSARQELAAIRTEVEAAGMGAPALSENDVEKRLPANARHLGKRRTELLARHAEAWARHVQDEDTEVLLRWRERMGDPFEVIDPEDALMTLNNERDRSIAAKERQLHQESVEGLRQKAAAIKNPLHIEQRRQIEAQARVGQGQVEQATAKLDQLGEEARQLRSDGLHLDCWMSRFGDLAARTAAVDQVLTVRRERELAVAPAAAVETEAAVELAEVGVAM
jgi:transposase-like protein